MASGTAAADDARSRARNSSFRSLPRGPRDSGEGDPHKTGAVQADPRLAREIRREVGAPYTPVVS